MKGGEEVWCDGDVVGCGGRVDGDYGHGFFIVSYLFFLKGFVLPDGPTARGAVTS